MCDLLELGSKKQKSSKSSVFDPSHGFYNQDRVDISMPLEI